MATGGADLHPERDAYEVPETQFKILIQQPSFEIPIGVLLLKVIDYSALARASALDPRSSRVDALSNPRFLDIPEDQFLTDHQMAI